MLPYLSSVFDVENSNLISNKQSGFHKNHSYTTALIEVKEEMLMMTM